MKRAAIFVLSGGSVAALLADVYRIAPMNLVFWYAGGPSMGLLVVIAVMDKDLGRIIRTGAIGGLIGTFGYDLARVPFALAGQRIFAPIESYGILIADATTSSSLTSTIGWLYHLSNGVTFGVAYAAIAWKRHWIFGIAWGLLLETVAIISPFGVRYGIAGQLTPILIAYLGHLAYGYPLGVVVQRGWQPGRWVTTAALGVTVLAVLGWQRPWIHPSWPDSPQTTVIGDRFVPEWVRVHKGQCVDVDNRSTTEFKTAYGTLAPESHGSLCFPDEGTKRVKLGPRPYSGGFVYVDPD